MYKRQELLDLNEHCDRDLLDADLSSELTAPESEYASLVETLSKEWLLIEMSHQVSKTASNAFWKLATELIPKLHAAKPEKKSQENPAVSTSP